MNKDEEDKDKEKDKKNLKDDFVKNESKENKNIISSLKDKKL